MKYINATTDCYHWRFNQAWTSTWPCAKQTFIQNQTLDVFYCSILYTERVHSDDIVSFFFVSLSHPYSMFTLMIVNEHIQCNTYLVQSIIYKNTHTKNVLLLTVVYGFTVVPRWLPCPFSIVSMDFIVNDINFRLSLS